ncbi:MAG: PP2C family protein-serine/threonine phosphatase [Lachnospira sp.]
MLILNYIISANTDIGTTKNTNQDSLSVKILNTPVGRMAFAVLCDGMGGLDKGEVASAAVINAFNEWVTQELPKICGEQLADDVIRMQWSSIITNMNQKIKSYGARQGVKLGTTAVIMLITDNRYYIMNVGDSRAYEISNTITQLTNDQTFVAREIAMGNMTPEQAETDSRRNVLLQCVGASDEVYPDMIYGETKQNAVYMLCSDGFRHVISSQEIFEKLNPSVLYDENNMSVNSRDLIEINKCRGETDNISVALVRTF